MFIVVSMKRNNIYTKTKNLKSKSQVAIKHSWFPAASVRILEMKIMFTALNSNYKLSAGFAADKPIKLKMLKYLNSYLVYGTL